MTNFGVRPERSEEVPLGYALSVARKYSWGVDIMDTENRQIWLQPREGRTLKAIEFTPYELVIEAAQVKPEKRIEGYAKHIAQKKYLRRLSLRPLHSLTAKVRPKTNRLKQMKFYLPKFKCAAIWSAMTVNPLCGPRGPGLILGPKARTGTCSRVWSLPGQVGSLP